MNDENSYGSPAEACSKMPPNMQRYHMQISNMKQRLIVPNAKRAFPPYPHYLFDG